jgi:hypothetical protein
MIHVATVHWRTDRWIDRQLGYLERFLPAPFRTYAFVNKVRGDHRAKFTYCSSQPIQDHATKLNLLGERICFVAEDPLDPILFLDGDAFPVTPLARLLHERLEAHRLIAVQRYENNGELQPHPCFCLTTVGFWREIEGDWRSGYVWNDLQGHPITDVGGNLLRVLTRAGIDWFPLRRVNKVDAHPLLFALYGTEEHGPLVYHHGGGFRRSAGGRVNLVRHGEREAKAMLSSRVLERLPRRGPLGWVRRRYSPVQRLRRSLKEDTQELSERILAEMDGDDEFWRRFA